MDFDKNIHAELIYDGKMFRIPSAMGDPSPDQMIGTDHDKLGELACRLCYDSLGVDPKTGKRKGRTSEKLHSHILEVRNHNVYEHGFVTVILPDSDPFVVLASCANRRGTWLEKTDAGVELTINHRAILEWDEFRSTFCDMYPSLITRLGDDLWNYARSIAPMLYHKEKPNYISSRRMLPKTDHLTQRQSIISLYLSMSRGCSHEQVRHRFQISQRSTRFTDESESPYVQHPFITQYLSDPNVPAEVKDEVKRMTSLSEQADKKTYNYLVGILQEYGHNMGLEATPARKNARGASRGFLGNALKTEMIFTASVTEWRWMLSQRGTKLADPEIRVLYCPQVLNCLMESQYSHFFTDISLEDSPDGIGEVATFNPVSIH